MKKPVKKSLKIKSKVQTVTTRQILLATLALLFANGFALATLPSKNIGTSRTVLRKVDTGGTTKIILTAPVQYADVGFVGKLEENFTVVSDDKGEVMVDIKYMNRGPVDVPPTNQVQGGTKIATTFLDQNQSPIYFEPESFYVREGLAFVQPLPAVSSGQSGKSTFSFSQAFLKKLQDKSVSFIKVELRVGERKIGGKGVFDPNIENNTVILPASEIFSLVK